MSLACGTFLAIHFIEILSVELNERNACGVASRMAVIIAGFLVIAISSIIESQT